LLLNYDPPDRMDEQDGFATGLRVWDGGLVLAKYLERYVPTATAGRPRLRGLELGAGTGVAGLSFALMGQEVILSDIGEKQATRTRSNIERNEGHIAAMGGRASYESLDWTALPERGRFGAFDMVFAADVIWHESLVDPFIQALAWAASGPGLNEVLLSHKVRDEESVNRFETQVGLAGFVIQQRVPSEPILGDFGHPDVVIYHLRRR